MASLSDTVSFFPPWPQDSEMECGQLTGRSINLEEKYYVVLGDINLDDIILICNYRVISAIFQKKY